MTVYINWSNVSSMADLPGTANVATGGGFWLAMLYMIWIILLLVMIVYGFETSILVSSFLSLIIGLMLVYANLIAWEWLMPFVAIIIITFLYITYQKNKT